MLLSTGITGKLPNYYFMSYKLSISDPFKILSCQMVEGTLPFNELFAIDLSEKDTCSLIIDFTTIFT